MGAIANLLSFPRANMRSQLGTAMKRHRLPESLGQDLVREAAHFPDVSADAALACAISRRLKPAPVDLENHGCRVSLAHIGGPRLELRNPGPLRLPRDLPRHLVQRDFVLLVHAVEGEQQLVLKERR